MIAAFWSACVTYFRLVLATIEVARIWMKPAAITQMMKAKKEVCVEGLTERIEKHKEHTAFPPTNKEEKQQSSNFIILSFVNRPSTGLSERHILTGEFHYVYVLSAACIGQRNLEKRSLKVNNVHIFSYNSSTTWIDRPLWQYSSFYTLVQQEHLPLAHSEDFYEHTGGHEYDSTFGQKSLRTQHTVKTREDTVIKRKKQDLTGLHAQGIHPQLKHFLNSWSSDCSAVKRTDPCSLAVIFPAFRKEQPEEKLWEISLVLHAHQKERVAVCAFKNIQYISIYHDVLGWLNSSYPELNLWQPTWKNLRQGPNGNICLMCYAGSKRYWSLALVKEK